MYAIRSYYDERLGQIAVVAELHDAHRAVALGEARAVGPQNHGHVGIDGRLLAHGAQDVDLARRVVDVVVAADDVADRHVHVVDHHGEVICRRTVRTGDDEVVEFVVGDADTAPDQIIENDVAVIV